ncbi:DNRLRE domain-containing protein [Brevibacillus agri]|uniref:DNRLRE domain-containing protein n=1 Tax=Brevibacillus agri TaxID=51101 RepID=UPI001EE5BB69|nr:DNRLRE domain-containing protein [Brevibacillus agri]MCG5252635.1 DNRLRE domain-containing protein [Brevibacillus agri]
MPVVTLTKNDSITRDNTIDQSQPTYANGSSTSLTIGSGNGASSACRSLIFFDLGFIPNDAIVNSATLTLSQTTSQATRVVHVHKVTSSWSSSVTWNTQPTFDASYVASKSVGSTLTDYSFTVTSLVQEWVNGTANNGFLIKDADETVLNARKNFGSFEYGSSPTLTIDYTIPSTGKKQVEYVGHGGISLSNGQTSSYTMNLPAGVQSGDLIIAVLRIGSTATITLPSGWSSAVDVTAQSAFRHIIAYKFASSGETSATFTTTGTNYWYGVTYLFRNVKAIHKKGGREVYQQTSYYPVTTTQTGTVDDLLSVVFNQSYASVSWTPPLSYSEKFDGNSGDSYNMAMRYLYTTRSQTQADMSFPVSANSSGFSGYLFLQPIANNSPTLTLTNPTDNLTLVEGSTYTLAGTASDPDNGNAVTVKYAINGGTARNFTSAVSDGSTPIPFTKALTFTNGRLYDGETDVSGPLAENTTYTLSVWAVDDQGGASPSYTRSFKVVLNRPPAINLDPYNANQTGLSELETLIFTGTVTDPENDTITLTAAFNGGAPVTIKSAVASGTTFTYSVPVSSLAQGSNTVVFTATDPKGASSTKTLTFTKSGTFTPVKTAVVRYAITPPLGTTAEVAAWVQREAGDLTVDAAASIVGSADPENYVALTKNASVPLGDGTIIEDEFVGAVAQPGAKVALRLTFTRENTSSTAAVKKIMGGIG